MSEDCLFCQFVSGERERHDNGFPFTPIHETAHTISFLSIDFPAHEDGHTLVIPKKHYADIEDVPPATQQELMEHISLAIKAIREEHEGANILLNDGAAAGQYIMHAHFHIVPRDENDGITIEDWEEKELSEERFVELSEALQEKMQALAE